VIYTFLGKRSILITPLSVDIFECNLTMDALFSTNNMSHVNNKLLRSLITKSFIKNVIYDVTEENMHWSSIIPVLYIYIAAQ